MNNRLQRWGERALGQVRSVSPRIASRFEPESGANSLEEQAGFQEIEVEMPVRGQPGRVVPPERFDTAEPTSLPSKPVEEKPAPVRVIKETVPSPAAPQSPPPPPPRRVSKPPTTRTIIAEPSAVPEEPARPVRNEPRPEESKAPTRQALPPSRLQAETSLVRLKRFEEWMATPPREKPSPPEPAPSPAQKQLPVPNSVQAEARRAPVQTQLPPLPRPEVPRTASPPIVVSIGTIIVRANPSMLPKPVRPPPADSLAAFLARRTAGQP